MLDTQADGLHPAGGIHLGENVADVVMDGPRAEEKPGGDLLIGETQSHKAEDLDLARRETERDDRP